MSFRDVLGDKLLLGDGAMGAMLEDARLPEDAFGGHAGCNDILTLTSPDVIAGIHDAYLEAGADWIETNTFGANLTALDAHGLAHRLAELNEAAARLARTRADAAASPQWPRYVVGSMGPGTRLPTLGQVAFGELRDSYQTAAEALIAGGADALQVETCQDPLQTKAGVIGALRAVRALGADVPVIVCLTFETNGTMLLGTTVGAALAATRHLGVAAVGLNCATGPDLMGPALRELSRTCPLPVVCMPNAGLPEWTPDGPRYPLTPEAFASAMDDFAGRFGLASVAGCCGTTPAHIAAARAVIELGRPVAARDVNVAEAVSSLYEAVDVRQDVNYLAVGERANVAGSKAFREAIGAARWDDCVEIAKHQAGCHVVDLCVDQTGRDTPSDMAELATRFATALTAPVMLDSSKPEVLSAGLERLPGRAIVNSVNLEDGDGPGSKYQRTMQAVAEHGAAVVALTIDEDGLATTCERKVAVAGRLIADLTGRWGLTPADIFVDLLTYPVTTGAADSRRAAAETIEALRQVKAAHPAVGTILGVSNVSFGLKLAARVVLNSVFLDECRRAGLDAAIVDAAKILPLNRIPDTKVQAARDLLWDDRSRSADPLAAFMALFEDDSAATIPPADQLATLPLRERLVRRVVDAVVPGLEADLDEALTTRDAISIVNDDLLPGMRQVGELFGQGKLQLPFVLASAEVMKRAVAHLEPALKAQQSGGAARGTLVLATVAGDVHDIGKNLVDIIVSNNGYKVVNLGVRVPVDEIVSAALREDATAIGLSGLLVKSAEVMRDDLAELANRGLADRFPVVLGGAALSRPYVDGLRSEYPKVFYAADAFDGLRVLEALRTTTPSSCRRQYLESQPAESSVALRQAQEPPVETRRHSPGVDTGRPAPSLNEHGRSSGVARNVAVPVPPFWGARQVLDIDLDDVLGWLDTRALLTGRWGLRAGPGQSIDDMAAATRPRLDEHIDHIRRDHLAQFAVAYGYWPAISDGDDMVLLEPGGASAPVARFRFPRQARPPHLALPDYFRDAAEAAATGPDVVALQVVTVGRAASEATAELFAADRYRDYLELHGLTVQLAEALAEMWHARVRAELGIGGADGSRDDILRHQAYQGERFSFGYPACPDLTQRRTILDLLDGASIGVDITETFQLVPEQSTDALIVHHPAARYFSVLH